MGAKNSQRAPTMERKAIFLPKMSWSSLKPDLDARQSLFLHRKQAWSPLDSIRQFVAAHHSQASSPPFFTMPKSIRISSNSLGDEVKTENRWVNDDLLKVACLPRFRCSKSLYGWFYSGGGSWLRPIIFLIPSSRLP